MKIIIDAKINFISSMYEEENLLKYLKFHERKIILSYREIITLLENGKKIGVLKLHKHLNYGENSKCLNS